MNSNQRLLLGGLIGGTIGFIIGAIIADYIAPEYYTEEELQLLGDILKDEGYHGSNEVLVADPQKAQKETRIIKVTKDYTKYYEDDQKPDLEELAKDNELEFVDDDGQYLDEEDVYEEIPIIDYNLLDDIDEDIFIDMRDTNVPYILLESEFKANETGFPQTTLYYFPDDDVLTTDDNKPVMSIERVVGDYALSNFGTFADEGDKVYVCNPQIGVEYMVVEMEGSYEEMVLNPPKAKEVVEHRNIFEDYVEPTGIMEGEEDDTN